MRHLHDGSMPPSPEALTRVHLACIRFCGQIAQSLNSLLRLVLRSQVDVVDMCGGKCGHLFCQEWSVLPALMLGFFESCLLLATTVICLASAHSSVFVFVWIVCCSMKQFFERQEAQGAAPSAALPCPTCRTPSKNSSFSSFCCDCANDLVFWLRSALRISFPLHSDEELAGVRQEHSRAPTSVS